MYRFIVQNRNRLEYNLNKGIVVTPKGTNGTLCSSTGYLRVKVNGKTLQVHQVLAVHYFGEECVGLQVNHKDGDKLNNKKENLEVVTQSENIRHQWDTGLSVGVTRLNKAEMLEIRRKHTPLKKQGPGTPRSLSKEYGVSPQTISTIVAKD